MYYLYKNLFQPGWYFILLGFIFSIKISSLPFVLLTFFFILFRHEFYNFKFIRSFIISILFFILGFLMGTPFLLINFNPEVSNVERYLNWTFLNTGHGSDSINISYRDWIGLINKKYSIFFPYSFFLLPSVGIFLFFRDFEFKLFLTNPKIKFNLYLLLSSLSFLLPVILFVKRTWLIYLFIGLFLLFLFCAIVFSNFLKKSPYSHNKVNISLSTLTIFYCFIIYPQYWKDFQSLYGRSSNNEHLIQLEKFKSIDNYFNSLPIKDYVVYYDPVLYSLKFKYTHIKIYEFWGPFVDWNKSPDFIVLHNYKIYEEDYGHDPSSNSYKLYMTSLILFKQHVTEKSSQPTYSFVFKDIYNTAILKRDN